MDLPIGHHGRSEAVRVRRDLGVRCRVVVVGRLSPRAVAVGVVVGAVLALDGAVRHDAGHVRIDVGQRGRRAADPVPGGLAQARHDDDRAHVHTDQQGVGHGQDGRGVDDDEVIAALELPDRPEHRLRAQELARVRRHGTRDQHVHRAGLAGLQGVRQLDGAGQDVDQALVLRHVEKRVDHGAAQVRVHQHHTLSGAGGRDREVHRQRGLALRGGRTGEDDGLRRPLLRREREVRPYLSIRLGADRPGVCLRRYRFPGQLEGDDAERRQPGCRLDISGVLEAPVERLHHERRRDTEHETEREPDEQVLLRLGGGRL